MPYRPRIIVALPTLAECAEVASWLAAEGFEPLQRPDSRSASDEMASRSFDLLISDVVLAFRDGLHAKGRGRNPRTPTILVGGAAAEPTGAAINGHTMYLTRPIDRAMLVCFVSMAMLDGPPARRSPRKPVTPFEVIVNGLSSRIVDVSREGLRLEVPTDGRSVLPPQFDVRVPMVGVSVAVQRVWARPSSSRALITWYGAALAYNRPVVEQAWQSFVDTIPAAGGVGAPVIV